jgi:hypothetical protein
MDIFSHNNMAPVSFRRYLNKVEVCLFFASAYRRLTAGYVMAISPHPINLVSALWAGRQK